MEDRKKTLRELETKKGETREVLNKLLENLGGSLITRLEAEDSGTVFSGSETEEGDSPHSIWNEKQKLNKEIEDTRDKIKAIEADLARLGELEGEINRKESESAEKTKEISLVYTELGRLILDDPGFDQFSLPHRQQLEDLFQQIDTHERKLNELERSEGGFLARLANGARGWLTKSQLAKNEAALKSLYRSAGEQFIVVWTDENSKESRPELSDESSWDMGIVAQVEKAEEFRRLQASLKEDVSQLLAERRKIADALNQEGNPVRRISGLEKFISGNQEEMRAVHRRFGASVREKDRKEEFASFYSEDDKALEEKIISLEESFVDTESRIEAIKTAIAIDNENAEIDKMKGVIEEKRKSIAQAEAAIVEIEEQIATAKKRVEELSESAPLP